MKGLFDCLVGVGITSGLKTSVTGVRLVGGFTCIRAPLWLLCIMPLWGRALFVEDGNWLFSLCAGEASFGGSGGL